MDAGSTLETIAEIAVTLTGFAGIAGALAGEKLRPTNPAIWLSFWVMISTSVGVLFCALFPFLPHYLGASDSVTWAASSAFIIAVAVAVAIFFMRAWVRATRPSAFDLAFDIPLNLSGLLVLVSQVLNTLGLVLNQSAGGFLIGLYFILLIAVLNFVKLLYALYRTLEDPPAA